MAKLEIIGIEVQALWRSRGLSDDVLSEQTGISIERLEEIVADNSGQVGELEKIAKCTKLTLTDILVGQAPPRLPTTDFRTLGSSQPQTSPELEHAIETVSARIEFISDEVMPHSKAAVTSELPNATNLKAPDAAERMRSQLGITEALQREFASNAFIFWRTRIEQLGVLYSALPMGGAARGFAIYHPTVSAIALASEEKHDGAKLFSLCHELGHLLRRESAISDQNWSKKTERWCNRFAAHLIMPSAIFRVAAERRRAEERLGNELRNVLSELAEDFGVSLSAIAFHLDDLNIGEGDSGKRYLASVGPYASQLVFGSVEEEQEDNSSGGGRDTHFYTKMNDYGLTYITLVQRVLKEGKLSRYEAAEALGTRFKYVDSLFEKTHKRVMAYGA